MLLGRLTGIAVLAFLVLAITATSALATTYLRRDPGGSFLSSGSTTLTSTAGTFTASAPGSGELSCQAQFDGAPHNGMGLYAEGSSTLTFTGCSNSLVLVPITSCRTYWSTYFTLLGAGTNGISTLGSTGFRCALASPAGAACYYGLTTLPGTYVNASATLSISGAQLDNTTGPVGATDALGALCTAPSGMTAGLDLRDLHTAGGTTLTVTTS